MKLDLTCRLSLLSVLLLGIAPIVGCSSHEVWTVTQYAHPNPLEGQTHMAVAPLYFDDLKVGEEREADYVARKGPDFGKKWLDDKQAMNALFVQKLRSNASYRGIRITEADSDAPFVIRPRVTFLQRGYFGGAFRQRARLKAVVEITRPNGDLVDQIVVHEIVEHVEDDHLNITAGARMRRLAEKLGRHTALYVQARVAGS